MKVIASFLSSASMAGYAELVHTSGASYLLSLVFGCGMLVIAAGAAVHYHKRPKSHVEVTL